MVSFPINKFGLSFRLVEKSDAAFIVGLRVDPRLSKHLSYTDNDIAKQEEWIEQYKKREKQGLEFYLLFETIDQKPLGVVRLYNFKGDTYTSGSWLVSPDSDELVAIKSDLFAAYFGFEVLKFDYCYIDIRKENTKVIRYHKRYFKQVDEDAEHLYLLMDKTAYEKKKAFLLPIINP